MGKNIHVVPNGENWVAKIEGDPNPVSVHRTQADAIDAAKPWAQLQHSELVIHRPDGTIRDKDSYGNDPFPTRDKKH